jgi:hypothetical protein
MPDSSPVSVKQNQNRACGQCNRCVPPKLRTSGALTSSLLTVCRKKTKCAILLSVLVQGHEESPLRLDEETYNIQATARNQNARFAIEPVRPVSIQHAESVPLRRGPSTCRERAF